MEKWIAPVLDILDVAQTENGAAPATYEADAAGLMTIGGEQWYVDSGYMWESGMERTNLLRPYRQCCTIVFYED